MARVIFLLTVQARVIFLLTEEKIFQKSTNQKQELPVVAMFFNRSQKNQQSLQRTFHRCFPTKFRFIWPSGFRGEDLKKLANQKQELPVVAMFVNGLGQNVQSLERTAHRCFLPSFGSFGQAVSEEKNLKNQPIRNKSRLWWSCLLTDRDEISNLNRGPAIDASYQVSVHLAKRFQRRRYLKIGQSETRIACGGHVC